MKTKKTIAIFSIAVLLLVSIPITVSAHGHSRFVNTISTRYTCDVDGCNIATNHKHNGVKYYGHTYDDGHDYHELCYVQGCTITKNHKHNGIGYFSCANIYESNYNNISNTGNNYSNTGNNYNNYGDCYNYGTGRCGRR